MMRAQRLSASQRWAYSITVTMNANNMCSTPFGITEVGIRRGSRQEPLRNVLNAFRHHRGGHRLAEVVPRPSH